jgi:hypothetical protein
MFESISKRMLGRILVAMSSLHVPDARDQPFGKLENGKTDSDNADHLRGMGFRERHRSRT